MKKVKNARADDMRSEYKRSDFKKLERGKFYRKVTAKSNVVILQPQIAEAFPTSDSVNRALAELLDVAKRSSRFKARPARPRGKVAPAG